jgi:hypothetical protein
MRNFQLRLNLKDPSLKLPTNIYEWEVVTLLSGQEADEIISHGENPSLIIASEQGVQALAKALRTPEGPARHEWECSCHAQLVIEASRSKMDPYGWDSPREITCKCGRVYGVKLNFAANTGVPFIEPIYRTTTNLPSPQ